MKKTAAASILVIDDDALFRKSLYEILRKHGFNVLEGESGEEGIALAAKHRPNLIICDVHMAQGDGFSVLETLRQARSTAVIPFVLMTGEAGEAAMRRGMQSGADDYLRKPFNRSQLLGTVEARLKRKAVLQEEAKRTEALLLSTLEATSDLVAIADENQAGIYLNRSGRELLGIGTNEDLSELLVRDFISEPAMSLLEQEAGAALSLGPMWSGETTLLSRAGKEIPVSVVIVSHSTPEAGCQYFSIIARNLSSRRQVEDALRQSEKSLLHANERLHMLSGNLVRVQETERRHLACELHDEIGQALTATKINLQAAQQLNDPAVVAERLEESIAVVDRLLQQVRHLSLDLRPPLLDDLGLAAALRWYIDQVAQRSGIRARFLAEPGLPRFHPNLETACFRIAQEALTNIVRHARADNATVRLCLENSVLNLGVRDDGTGFDVDAARCRAAQGVSVGLLGMEERVTLIGGTLTISSNPDQGTEIAACFPISCFQPEQTVL